MTLGATGRLLIIYSAFAKYLREKWELNEEVYQLFIDWKKAYDSVIKEYAIRRVQVNRNSLKLNGTHQLLAYVDDVIILAGSLHNSKETAESLVAATREIRLEVSADKTKYMIMSLDQNVGRIQS